MVLPIVLALWKANYSVYGAHKPWKAARRAGHHIGRDQVARHPRRAAGAHAVHDPPRRQRCAGAGPGQPAVPRTAAQRVVGHGPHLRCDVVGSRVRVLHRGRVQPHDRRLAGGGQHAHRHGPRRPRDGALGAGDAARRPGVPLRCRQPVHVTPLRRASRRVRRGAFDRERRGLVRQRARTSRERLVQGPGSSAGKDRGATSTRSDWPPSAGSTGGTHSGSTARSATSRRQSSRPTTTVNNRPTRWLAPNKPSLHQTQGESLRTSWADGSLASRWSRLTMPLPPPLCPRTSAGNPGARYGS